MCGDDAEDNKECLVANFPKIEHLPPKLFQVGDVMIAYFTLIGIC